MLVGKPYILSARYEEVFSRARKYTEQNDEEIGGAGRVA
jgi:hypothetical protein